MSRAFEKAGNTPFVLKGGAVNSVKCSSVNAQAGLAKIINMDRPLNINQSTPATGPTGSVSHLSFNEDNSQLISSVKGTPTDLGFIATKDIFMSIAPPTGGVVPFGMSIISDANAVLATDPAIGFDLIPLLSKNASSAGAAAGSVTNDTGQTAVCWSSHSTMARNFYLTDIVTSLVTEASVHNLEAKVVWQYQ
jgi:hypothetical protein